MGVERVLGARVISLQDGLMQLGVHSGPAMEAHAKLRIEPTWREGVRVVRQVGIAGDNQLTLHPGSVGILR